MKIYQQSNWICFVLNEELFKWNRNKTESFKGLLQCCDFMNFLYCFYLYLDSICYKLNHPNHLCPLGQIKFISESLWIIASAPKEIPNIYIWYLSIVMKSQTTT